MCPMISTTNKRRGIDGNAEHIALAEEVPGIAVDRVGGEYGGEFLVQDVDRGAQDDQRHQGGEKWTRLEIADQQAVDAADCRADRHRAEDDQRDRQPGDVEQEQRGEIAEREDGADAEIDATGDQAERHADGDEAELGVEPHQRKKILHSGIVGNRRGEPKQQRDHQGEGDHRLEPLLQQQFREQEPRRQAGVQPRAEAGAHGAVRHQRAPFSGQLPHPGGRLPPRGGSHDQSCYFFFGRHRHRRGRCRLRQGEAIAAAGVALVEPDRLGVVLIVFLTRLLLVFQQGDGGGNQIVALLGRLVAQELVEVPLVDLVAIELRALARGIDLYLIDLARVTDRLRGSRFHDAPKTDAGAKVGVLLDHCRGDVEGGIGIPVRCLVGDDLDRRILLEGIHDAADLINAGGGGEFALHDRDLARLAAAGATLLDDVLGQQTADLIPVGADEGVRLVVRGHVHLNDMGALCLGTLQLLHQQRDARVLHDQHIRLVIDQGGQRLLHRRRIVVGVAHHILHAAPSRFGPHHALPFVLQWHAERDRQEGDGLAFDSLIVVGSKLMRRLRATFLLRHRDKRRPRHQRKAGKCHGRLRQE